MTAVDSDILIYSHRRDSDWHEPAKQAVKQIAESGAGWAIPWPCIHEFLGIATHPKIYGPPTTVEQAIRQVELWFASPSLTMVGERGGYWEILKNTLAAGKIRGPRVHDARIYSICLENGVKTLMSADRDFNRFSGLKVVNPLIGA